MGGPGGTSTKAKLIHPVLSGNSFPEEDFYNRSACVNCHTSVPQNTCSSCHNTTPFFSNAYLPRPSPCNAEIRWPDFLQTPIPKIQDYPWWVEQNFLATQLQKPGNPISPEKIDFGIEVYLKPGIPFHITNDYFLETLDNAKIVFAPHLAGKGENLSVLLEGQELIKLENIRVKPNKWYASLLPNNLLQQVGIQDGHVFLRAAIGALNLFRNSSNPSYSDVDLQQYILPELPIAYDLNTGKVYKGENYDEISKSSNPEIQKIASTYEFFENKQFPQLMKLSEVIQLIQDFAKIAEIKKRNGEKESEDSEVSKAISSLVLHLDTVPDEIKYPNFYAKFHPDPNNKFSLVLETNGVQKLEKISAEGQLDLDEVFVPKWLHLENSQATFHLKYLEGKESLIDLENIHAKFKTMDFLKDNLRKLGLLQIDEGEIQDGDPLQFMGFDFAPGIHIRQLGSELIQVQANLKIHTKIFLPILGEVEVDAPLVFETQLKADPLQLSGLSKSNSDKKIGLLPQSSLFFIPHFQVQIGKNSKKQFYETNFLFSDIPSFDLPNHMGDGIESGFRASVNIVRTENSPVRDALVEIFLPIEIDPYGSYLMEDLFTYQNLRTFVNLNTVDHQNITGELHWMSITKQDTTEANLYGSLNQFDSKGKSQKPIAKNLNLHFVEEKHQSGSSTRDIRVSADFISAGILELSHPDFHLAYSSDRLADGSTLWTLHKFIAQANKSLSAWKAQGVFQGPVTLRSTSKAQKPFQLHYNPKTHKAEIFNLGLRFDFKRISIPGLAKYTNRAITGIDLDGQVQGHWKFDTESYAGKGLLLIRGDKEGDIHFRGKNKKRLEAVLDPNDPNRYYEIPLLADTRFRIDRIQAFDSKQNQVKGHFHLSTLVDWLALKALGIEWNEHDEFVFDFDHLPYSSAGYGHKIREFFTYIAKHPPKMKNQENQQ